MKKILPESSIAGVESTLTRVFTLDQLRPNPDDPRKTRNPRFDYIKESIRARGLASVPIVTRDPRLPGKRRLSTVWQILIFLRG